MKKKSVAKEYVLAGLLGELAEVQRKADARAVVHDRLTVTITIEGIIGSGKTIVAQYLAAQLSAAGFRNIELRDQRGDDEGPKGHLIGDIAPLRNIVVQTRHESIRARKRKTRSAR